MCGYESIVPSAVHNRFHDKVGSFSDWLFCWGAILLCRRDEVLCCSVHPRQVQLSPPCVIHSNRPQRSLVTFLRLSALYPTLPYPPPTPPTSQTRPVRFICPYSLPSRRHPGQVGSCRLHYPWTSSSTPALLIRCAAACPLLQLPVETFLLGYPCENQWALSAFLPHDICRLSFFFSSGRSNFCLRVHFHIEVDAKSGPGWLPTSRDCNVGNTFSATHASHS